MKKITILEAMEDPTLFGRWFKPQRRWFGKSRDSWAAWKSFLRVLFALPMSPEDMDRYQKHAGRTDAPVTAFREGVAIVGRRGGKSLIAALIASFLAAFVDYTDILQSGESGVVMLLASDRRQARVLLNYVFGFFDSIPMLRRMVVSKLKESITLNNGITIEVHTSSYRAVRGFTVVAAICDEIAFWPREDSASPDVETLNALRPAMLTVPTALLLSISSPYAKRGALWELHRENFGKESAPVLVWTGDSESHNPTVPSALIKLAYLRDAASARAEYGAIFRDDVSGFLTQELLESCVVRGRTSLPRLADVTYCAFVDPSGGRNDSMTLGIAHLDGEKAVLDLLLERAAPFSPEAVTDEFVGVLKKFDVSEVTGDKYGAEWCAEQFTKRGITYRPSERSRSQIYLEFLPAVTSGQIELLDDSKIVNQFVGLERRTGRGQDLIDHGPGGHDDLSNSCAGCLVLALEGAGGFAVLEMHSSGRFARMYDGIVAATQHVTDVFGKRIENPRDQNLNKEKLFPMEARLRGLDPAKLNPSGADTWKQPKAPPCPSCKSICTVPLGSNFHCNQCGFDNPNPAVPQEYLINTRTGPGLRRR